MPHNSTMLLTVFTQRNFVADFLQAKCDFTENGRVAFLRHLYDHLRVIGKRLVDFLLVLTELFSLGVTSEALPAFDRRTDGQTDGRTDRHLSHR